MAYLAGLHAQKQVQGFVRAHKRTAQVQRGVLNELIELHRDTAFGRDHGFAHINSYESFRRSVPLCSYEDLRPYINRVLQGETNALLPANEKVLMFSMTSGTTGLPKHIPVSDRFARQMKRGWNIWGVQALKDHPDGWLRAILQISSPMQEETSPQGLPCGAISGLLSQYQKKIVRRMYVVPQTVASVSDPNTKYYTILRCGIMRDVAFITTANPSSTIKLIETGQQYASQLVQDVFDGTLTPPGKLPDEIHHSLQFKPNPNLARRLEQGIARDGKLLPKHFWNPAFLANWTGGTLKLYLPRLQEMFGQDVPIRDIGLLASEGRFSIPLESGTSAGVAEITGNFLEFLPAEQRDSDNPELLRAHEVQVGHEYFLVVTNWAGLWRYNLDDRVRIVDRLGDSPVFEFLSRGKHTSNITGEKITEHQVVEAMRLARQRTGMEVERFVVQGRFAETPYYEVRLETNDMDKATRLVAQADKTLAELNLEYHAKRKSGRLGPLQLVRLAPGQMADLENQEINQRRGRSEQYKPTYLQTEILPEETA